MQLAHSSILRFTKLLFVTFCVFWRALLFAQVSPDLEQGMKPYGSYHGGDLDHISMSNGNLFFQASLLSYSQRGGELTYPIVLQYNEENFNQFQNCQPGQPITQCQTNIVFGPQAQTIGGVSTGSAVWIGFEGTPAVVENALDPGFYTGLAYNGSSIYVQTYSVTTQDGSLHQLVNTNNGMVVTDGSGFFVDSGGTLHDRNGTKFLASGTIEDANGNQINPSTGTDTLGRHIPAMPGPAYAAATPPASTASLGACPALGYVNQPVTYAYTWNLPTVNGGSLPLILCYASVYVRTTFFGGQNLSNWHELSQSFTMLQSVVFPENTYWSFQYDAADPNNTGSIALADLLKVTLPTGGSISYTWGPCSCTTLFGRSVMTRTVDANDGTGSQRWHYSYNNGTFTVVQDPLGNETTHSFTLLGGMVNSIYETQTQYFQGSHTGGTLLKSVQADYQFTSNPWDASAIQAGGTLASAKSVTNVFPIRVTTALANGLVSKTETDYDTALSYHGPVDGIQYNYLSCSVDANGIRTCTWTTPNTFGATNYTGSYGKVVATREYDWGQGAPGPLLRQTLTNYQWQSNSNYLTYNFLDLVYSSTVKDGAGHQVTQTTYGYDEYAVNPSNISTQRNANPVNGNFRGNQTSVHRWLNGIATSTPNCAISVNNGFLVSFVQYNDTGTVNQSTDSCGTAAGDINHRTSHTYDPTYAGAYSTQTCDPLGHCVSGTYDFNTGLLTSFTNANAAYQASGTTQGDPAHTSNYSYDSRWRLTTALLPPDPAGQRPETDFNYPNVTTVERLKKISSTLTDDLLSYFDGVGRPYKTVHASAGNATMLTTYDAVGRVASVTNPYFTTSDPTYGVTFYQYDALGRTTQTTKQDGSMTLAQYDLASGATNCTLTTDEAGKQRKACTDGLGRLVEVDEPQPSSLGASATASVTISGGLASYQTAAPPPAVTGSALAGFADSSGNQHWVYLGTNQHLYNLFWTSPGLYGFDDVTAATGAPVASGTAVTGFPSGLAQWAYFGSNQHVYNFWWNGSYGYQDATAGAGAPAAAAGSPLIGFVDSGGAQHWAYFGTNQHVYNIYWNGSYGYGDATAGSGAPAAASGSALTAFGDSSGGQHWAYVGTNQHIYNLYWTSGTGYGYQDATAGASAPLTTSGSKLAGFADSSGGQRWAYLDNNGHAYNLYWICCGSYGYADLTSATGAPAASGNAIAGFMDSGGNQHWAYFTSSLDVLNFWLSNGSYGYQDATAGAGAPVATNGSALTGFKDPSGGQHWAYFGTNQHVYNVWWNNGSYGYKDVNASTDLVYDAGTVSLNVGGFTATVCYGHSTNSACTGQPVNTTTAQVAAALANAINAASSPATASVSGSTINLTWKVPGPFTPSLSALSTTHDNPSQFANPSFTSPATNFANGTGNLGNNPYVTLYSYDTLGDLLRVDQKGTAASDSSQWRTRLFTYDSLARLLTAYNPESGTISYSYDADSNVLQKTSPAPNQTGTATQTISYCYDRINRIAGKQYGATSCPLSSPVVSYNYDSGANGIGHLTSLMDQAGPGSYSYDALGRIASEQRTIAGVQKSLSYVYYLDNSIKDLTYPSGATVTYTPDAAGRMVSAIDNGNNIQYVTSATYGADDSLTGFVSGHSSAFSGITSSFSYNKRLQPVLMSATAPNQTVFSIGYDFHFGAGNNGNVFSLINYRDQSRTQAFTYDALNRLISAQNAGADCTRMTVNNKTEYWGNSYAYDAWGNLTTKTPSKCSAENLNEAAWGSNQLHTISGPDNAYDAAGNMVHDATTGMNYTYDAENRITGAGGYTYTYDADGNRVEKSNGSMGTIYWYMSLGIVAESDLTGALKSEYIFFDGERVARKDFSGSTTSVSYYFSDHLKTASMITDSAGNITEDEDYYPWGGELQFVNNDSNHYKFTGKERDGETGLDYFGSRYYGNWLGRFITPDWASTPGPVPYADLGDPQSLNQYSYVRNIATSKVDNDGHEIIDPRAFFRLADAIMQGGKHLLVETGKGLANATVDTLNFVVLDVLGHGDAPADRIPVPFPNRSTTSKVIEIVAPLLIPGVGEEEEVGLMAERELQGAANRAAESVGEGSGAVHGTEVHAAFRKEVETLKDPNLHTEVSYKNGKVVDYGTPGSVRVDVAAGSPETPTAIFDLKTGNAKLTPVRIRHIRRHLPKDSRNVPVKEIRPQSSK